MATEKPKTYRIVYTTNVDKGRIKVKFTPDMKTGTLQDLQVHVNSILSGTHIALVSLLNGLAMMRPATDEERDAQVYIFKNEEQDNQLYKSRLQLHDTLANTFDGILKTIFPDVQYIEQVRKHQQEIIFEMTEEEAQEHQTMLANLAEKIRQVDIQLPDNDGDIVSSEETTPEGAPHGN